MLSKLHYSQLKATQTLPFIVRIYQSYLCVYYMFFTPGCKIHEAQDHICLISFCIPNINTRPSIIILTTFIFIITSANIYCHVQCVRLYVEYF